MMIITIIWALSILISITLIVKTFYILGGHIGFIKGMVPEHKIEDYFLLLFLILFQFIPLVNLSLSIFIIIKAKKEGGNA
jgi:hypothetical protein